MCLQCICQAEPLGEIVPGLLLTRATKDSSHGWKAGQFGLVRCNDPDLVWTTIPIPDPMEGMTDEQIEALPHDQALDWCSEAAKFKDEVKGQLDMNTTLQIAERCIAAGYNSKEDGFLEYWLFHRMGLLLQGPQKENPCPDPHSTPSS